MTEAPKVRGRKRKARLHGWRRKRFRRRLETDALIDTGCDNTSINAEWIKQEGLNTVPMNYPIEVLNADGSKNAHGKISRLFSSVLRVGEHHEIITANVTRLHGRFKIYLGMDWIDRHNPQIDWSKRTIIFNKCTWDQRYHEKKRRAGIRQAT